MQKTVTITMSEDAARAVLRAVENDPDRTKWGHHQWLRIEAETDLRAARLRPAQDDAQLLGVRTAPCPECSQEPGLHSSSCSRGGAR